MSIICHHKQSEAQNVIIHCRLLSGQLHTHPPILPDVATDDPIATFCSSFNLACTKDTSFIDACQHAVNAVIGMVLKAAKHHELDNALQAMPDKFKEKNIHGLKLVINKSTPVHAI